MPTAWGAHSGGWRRGASGTDLGALFAATASLTKLHDALQDRRLEAEIASEGHAWRAALAVGRIAAPLWLADALVALAGAFYDAEAQPHAERPASVPAATQAVVAALLLPVEDIVADVAAALADQGRSATLAAPLIVGPGGAIAADEPLDPPGLPYARELASGAQHVHTSAAGALASLRSAIGASGASPLPNWLEAGLRRVDGELQAAAARLDMDEVRLASLDGTRVDPGVLDAICRDLWRVVQIAVAAGQSITDPHLLPEAAAAGQSGAVSQAPTVGRAPFVGPHGHEAALPLPSVDAGAAPLRRSSTPAPFAAQPIPAPEEVALPRIEEAPLPRSEQHAAALPDIGEATQSRENEPPRPESQAAQPPRTQRARAGTEEDTPPVNFPRIG